MSSGKDGPQARGCGLPPDRRPGRRSLRRRGNVDRRGVALSDRPVALRGPLDRRLRNSRPGRTTVVPVRPAVAFGGPPQTKSRRRRPHQLAVTREARFGLLLQPPLEDGVDGLWQGRISVARFGRRFGYVGVQRQGGGGKLERRRAGQALVAISRPRGSSWPQTMAADCHRVAGCGCAGPRGRSPARPWAWRASVA